MEASSLSNWSLSSGSSKPSKRYIRRSTPAIPGDDARRIIHSQADRLRRFRREQGSTALTPRWIRRTPDQMVKYVEADRDGRMYGKHVVAAIRVVRQMASRPEGSFEMREVMASFVAKLTFREMCVVLKEQKGWRQARDFFAWMKLQISYRPSVVSYTIILQLYGQVGKIKLAEETFLEMLELNLEPDELACGTLLCAYARWARLKDMLLFYTAVQKRGIIPSISVFNFMISSLQKEKFHSKVISLWDQILERKLVPTSFTYSVVIGSFVKEMRFDDALKVFDEMKGVGFTPDESSYSHLINFYCKNGNKKEALRLYEEMKFVNVVPSSYTCASLLTLFYKNSDYSKALSLFGDMEREKVAIDEVIYGILVRIYGKIGFYQDAIKTFEDIKRLGLLKSEKTYVAMAQVHLSEGNYEKALEVLEIMKVGKVKMTDIGYSALLRCHVAKGDWSSAETCFLALIKRDVISFNLLLGLYLKLDNLEKAKGLIAEIRKSGARLDEELYKTVLEVFYRDGSVCNFEEIISEMENYGIVPDKSVKMKLVELYGKRAMFKKAEELLKKLNFVEGRKEDQNVNLMMLTLYVETFDENRFIDALKSGHDGPFLACQLICKFVRKGKIEEAKFIYETLIGLGFRLDAITVSIYVNTLTTHGKYEEAESVIYSCFRDEVALDTIAYNTCIKSMLEAGKLYSCVSIYNKMISCGVSPSLQTYGTMISVYGRGGKLEKAIEMFNTAQNLDVSMDEKLYTNMISYYGKAGRFEEAAVLFNKMKEDGIKLGSISYNAMINVYATSGLDQEAESLFHQMRKNRNTPDSFTYLALTRAYTESKKYSKAEEIILQTMPKEGLIPSSSHFNHLIFAFIKEGSIKEAHEIYNKMRNMKVRPDLSCCRSMMRAFLEFGFVQEGIELFETLREFVKPDSFILSVAVHLYEFVGKESEAATIIDLINMDSLLFIRNLTVGSKKRV